MVSTLVIEDCAKEGLSMAEVLPYRVVSLFTGAGGLDLGFEAHGCETVVAVDNDHESCKTLRHNRPNWEVFEGDIRDFHPSIVDADLVIGGPPCQGFSSAGKGDPDDPRNFLWREYMRVVETVRPRAIVLENVSALTHRKNGGHLSGIMQALNEQGFELAYGVLNAADFGVPQARRRLVVIGLRGGVPTLPEPTHIDQHISVAEAISDLQGWFDEGFNHIPPTHAPHVVERWRRLEPGES